MQRAGLALILSVLLLMPLRAVAQDSQQTQEFMSEMIAITNDISEETAKEAAGKCVAMGEKLKVMQGLIPAQRLYFESEVERCLFYAMNNGNFSDSTGDMCSHHIAYSKKLAELIEASLSVPGTEGEYMANFASQMDYAISMGQQLGCKFDYTVFAKTVEAATAAGQKQPKEPDFAFMEEIAGVTSAITPETAKADMAKCTALKAKLAEKKELFAFEQHYYTGMIENCLAMAMEKGAPADEDGDACAHLYRYGEKAVLAIAESKRQPGPFEPFAQMLAEELAGLATHAKQAGCKQDFAVLTAG